MDALMTLARSEALALISRDRIRNGSDEASELRQSPEYRAAKTLQQTADRIESLEAQVRAADALAAWASAISERKASPVTGGRLILERDIVGLETSLAAYRATKEGGA